MSPGVVKRLSGTEPCIAVSADGRHILYRGSAGEAESQHVAEVGLYAVDETDDTKDNQLVRRWISPPNTIQLLDDPAAVAELAKYHVVACRRAPLPLLGEGGDSIGIDQTHECDVQKPLRVHVTASSNDVTLSIEGNRPWVQATLIGESGDDLDGVFYADGVGAMVISFRRHGFIRVSPAALGDWPCIARPTGGRPHPLHHRLSCRRP